MGMENTENTEWFERAEAALDILHELADEA